MPRFEISARPGRLKKRKHSYEAETRPLHVCALPSFATPPPSVLRTGQVPVTAFSKDGGSNRMSIEGELEELHGPERFHRCSRRPRQSGWPQRLRRRAACLHSVQRGSPVATPHLRALTTSVCSVHAKSSGAFLSISFFFYSYP
ncbi:hypothetical protein TNCV_3458801 [Trichonephila clavipes]|nr:hypothetical protein TNCV_3458801 [Trichonephila clavipes]